VNRFNPYKGLKHSLRKAIRLYKGQYFVLKKEKKMIERKEIFEIFSNL
jgi:hypothetical protein